MRSLLITLISTLSLLSSSNAAPAQPAPLDDRQVLRPDAPYSVSRSVLEAAIKCPNGIQGKAGGVVLLVHGTGYTAEEAWALGPYIKFLPTRGPGFDVCWVSIPNRALGDAQVSAEYVAWNIPRLAKQSKTGKVALIGHSQGGGLTCQWALTFWGSARRYVSDYIGLAADFQGSWGSAITCIANATKCNPSVWQQHPNSKYLGAQNFQGARALVPTTSIWTRFDEVVLQNFWVPSLEQASSYIPGGVNIRLQEKNVCGLLYFADHFLITGDPATFFLVVDALTHPGQGANPSRALNPTDCLYIRDNLYLSDWPNNALRLYQTAVISASTLIGNATREPPLKKYVCDLGRASNCGS